MSRVCARAIAVSCSSSATGGTPARLSIAVDQRQHLASRPPRRVTVAAPDAGAARRDGGRRDPAVHGEIGEHGAADRARRHDLDLVPAVRARSEARRGSRRRAAAASARARVPSGAVITTAGMREAGRDARRDRRVTARRQAPRDRPEQRRRVAPAGRSRRRSCRPVRSTPMPTRPMSAARIISAISPRARAPSSTAPARRGARQQDVRRRLDQPVVREQELDHVQRRQLVAAHLPRQIGHRPVEAHVRLGRRLRRCLRAAARTSSSNARRSGSRGSGLRPSPPRRRVASSPPAQPARTRRSTGCRGRRTLASRRRRAGGVDVDALVDVARRRTRREQAGGDGDPAPLPDPLPASRGEGDSTLSLTLSPLRGARESPDLRASTSSCSRRPGLGGGGCLAIGGGR